ncbi:MAG: non-homologous end-joining DNA ligase [Acidimicrobiia bacterium]
MSSIRFGISGLPPEGTDDAAFLDDLVARGHRAFELSFTQGFPWKERRCESFGRLAAERDIALSAHAPYFAGLTVPDKDKGRRSLAAVEHTMKLGHRLGAPIIVAHLGSRYDDDPETLMGRIRARLNHIAPKVAHLGISLGLETAGSNASFGSLGDIALLAEEFSFVRPVVDWAHIHALTQGGLTSKEAFASVLQFVAGHFPAWMLYPLHCQFSDIEYGDAGEIRHIPYREGTLRVGPLIEAALERDMSLVLISEARDWASHDAIWDEVQAQLSESTPSTARFLASTPIDFPDPVEVVGDESSYRPLGLGRPLLLTNIDKVFFPDDGYTKGDLVQYYASIAPVLLPHLLGRPITMARFPDGIAGESFYEKRAPGHQPPWMRTVPVPSGSQGGDIEFLLADSTEALMWFANMGCIEMHPFHARVPDLDHPTYAIFDFDPSPGSSWDQVVAGVKLLKVALDQLGLDGYPKLSGSRGMHVYVPLEPVHDHARVLRFVGAVAAQLVAANPDDLTIEWEKSKREGRVFIDHNRNASGQTVASVYSVRPRRGAPVSAPLGWEEVGTMANGDITIANLWERLRSTGDLFAPVARAGQTLDAAEAALGLVSP